jgi:quercetin dioxygenase-like cupin family protein
MRGKSSVNAIYLGAGGNLGMHAAETKQLFLVVSGRGWVRTNEDDDNRRVIAGHAVYWAEGEHHETMTHNGLTAIIIEGANVNPDQYMQLAPLDDNNTRIW